MSNARRINLDNQTNRMNHEDEVNQQDSDTSSEDGASSRQQINAMRISIAAVLGPIRYNDTHRLPLSTQDKTAFNSSLNDLRLIIGSRYRQSQSLDTESELCRSRNTMFSYLRNYSIYLTEYRLDDETVREKMRQDACCFHLVYLLDHFLNLLNLASHTAAEDDSLNVVYRILDCVRAQLVESLKEPSDFFTNNIQATIKDLTRSYVRLVLKFQFFEKKSFPEITRSSPWLKLLQDLKYRNFDQGDFFSRCLGAQSLKLVTARTTHTDADQLSTSHAHKNALFSAKIGAYMIGREIADRLSPQRIFSMLTANFHSLLNYQDITAEDFMSVYFSPFLALPTESLTPDNALLQNFLSQLIDDFRAAPTDDSENDWSLPLRGCFEELTTHTSYYHNNTRATGLSAASTMYARASQRRSAETANLTDPNAPPPSRQRGNW